MTWWPIFVNGPQWLRAVRLRRFVLQEDVLFDRTEPVPEVLQTAGLDAGEEGGHGKRAETRARPDRKPDRGPDRNKALGEEQDDQKEAPARFRTCLGGEPFLHLSSRGSRS